MNLRMPDKKLLMLGFMASGAVHVYVNPRMQGVQLPDIYRRDSRVCLAYGDCLPRPTENVQVDERGIKATLLLNEQPVDTTIPWSAVFYMETPAGGSAMWLDDYPDDLRQELESALQDEAGDEEEQQEAPAPRGAAAGGGGGGAVIPRARPEWLRLV